MRFTANGDSFHPEAMHNAPPAYAEARGGILISLKDYLMVGLAHTIAVAVQIADPRLVTSIRAADPFPGCRPLLSTAGSRPTCCMTRGNRYAVFNALPSMFATFTAKQIELS